MKQFHFGFSDIADLSKKLDDIRKTCKESKSETLVVHVFTQIVDRKKVDDIYTIIKAKLPFSLCLGASSNGSLAEGRLTDDEVLVVCTLYEHADTKIKLFQYSFSSERFLNEIVEMVNFCNENKWVKSVEMITTGVTIPMQDFCGTLDRIRPEVDVFGGKAYNPDVNEHSVCVFSDERGYSENGVVFLLTGGTEYHVCGTYVAGWKPLGKKFVVTKSKKDILYELDRRPAFDAYRKYLRIEKNEYFSSNVLEFPFIINRNGISILRAPVAVMVDDALVLSAAIPENSEIRLAYGDPETILQSIQLEWERIAAFRPDVIHVFTCAGRRGFWGDKNISKETSELQKVAPTTGFYTHGEFLRIDGILYDFNVTLVMVGIREGEATKEVVPIGRQDEDPGRMSFTSRLINFIGVATAEMEALNKKLELVAVMDGLTKLYNRVEIEDRIAKAIRESTNDPAADEVALIMLDIDNFKGINDTYGHHEGDRVIIALSDLLRRITANIPRSSVGRWGGEEFMVLLRGMDLFDVLDIAEEMRSAFEGFFFRDYNCTVSVGVTLSTEKDSVDTVCNRVDEALYEAKQTGKNKVVNR